MGKWMGSWLLALAAIAGAPAGGAADMSKTLRVAFLVDVTGFDPQAMSDAYSGYYNLLDNMTYWAMSAVAREVIQMNADGSG